MNLPSYKENPKKTASKNNKETKKTKKNRKQQQQQPTETNNRNKIPNPENKNYIN